VPAAASSGGRGGERVDILQRGRKREIHFLEKTKGLFQGKKEEETPHCSGVKCGGGEKKKKKKGRSEGK